jgi:hypothetical protein
VAAIKSTRALTASTDGSDAGAVFNVDTVNGIVQIPNGAKIRLYSDAYSTQTQEITANGRTPIISATSPDPGANGTIATSGVDIALVTPAANRTGIILQAGTYNGQEVWVVNQGSNTLALNTTPATSNVADSATEGTIGGLTARKYVWIGGSTNLWYQAKGA